MSWYLGIGTVYIGAVYSICNLKYSVSDKIPIAFNHGSKDYYHFIINELAEFKKQFTCLGENTEKDIIFTVPVKHKVLWIDKKGNEITKKISYW